MLLGTVYYAQLSSEIGVEMRQLLVSPLSPEDNKQLYHRFDRSEVVVVIGQRHRRRVGHVLLKPLDVGHVEGGLGGLQSWSLHKVQVVISRELPREPDEGLLKVVIDLFEIKNWKGRTKNILSLRSRRIVNSSCGGR